MTGWLPRRAAERGRYAYRTSGAAARRVFNHREYTGTELVIVIKIEPPDGGSQFLSFGAAARVTSL